MPDNKNNQKALSRRLLSAISNIGCGKPVDLKDFNALGMIGAERLLERVEAKKMQITVGNPAKDFRIIFRRAAAPDNIISTCNLSELRDNGQKLLQALGRAKEESPVIQIARRGTPTGFVLAKCPV